MSWAARAIATLSRGEQAVIRPRRTSMRPKVRSGARVTLEPVTGETALCLGDIVLVKVRGATYLHLITALEADRVQIGNNRGRVNGWTSRSLVYGRAVAIEN